MCHCEKYLIVGCIYDSVCTQIRRSTLENCFDSNIYLTNVMVIFIICEGNNGAGGGDLQ